MIASSRWSHTAVHSWQPGWSGVFLALVAASIAGFFFAPWSVEAKSLAVLHGLCAQRPSHSFWFGADRLPFDARMTGIYGGFLMTQLYLLLRGRFRAAGIPSIPVIVTLALFIVAMGLDGLNSTVNDTGLFTVYQPSNVLRYITGALTGTTLAVFLWLLINTLLWSTERQRTDRVIGHFSELLLIGAALAGFGLLVMSGWQPSFRVISFLLVGSAIFVMFQLSIAFIQLTRRKENTARSLSDLSGAAIGALVSAYFFISFVAGSRFLMEAALHVKQLS
jgi:uncharacterized membrane protein